MFKFILKVILWRLTPSKKRGQAPTRPAFDLIRTFVYFSVVVVVVASVLTFHDNIRIVDGEITLAMLRELVEAERVERVVFGLENGQLLRVELFDGGVHTIMNPNYPDFRRELMESGVDIRFTSGNLIQAITTTITAMLFTLILLVICAVLLRTVVHTNQVKAVRARDVGITFSDIRGMSETKEEMRFAVEQLQNVGLLRSVGIKPVKGILLEGPPGTGKTLLAKAIAGEAGVPLISASGADFIEMFVGVGAARIRRLWMQAIDSAPCVLFIDEIDAVGRTRGANSPNMESNQTINALLQKMDGLGSRTDILVIGATNRKEDLDAALTRPGRFDRTIHVGAPRTPADTADICELYLSKIQTDICVTPERVAKMMVGMTGAEIAQCINDAALLVMREIRDAGGDAVARDVTLLDLDKAVTRHLLGGVATEHATERDIKTAAVHEAGHAIMCLVTGVDVLKVSITPFTSGAGGVTQSAQPENKLLTAAEVEDKILFLLGGYAAEKQILGQRSVGASDDLQKVSELALQLVLCFGAGGQLLSEIALQKVLGYRGVSDEALARAERILQEINTKAEAYCEQYESKLNELAERLLNETTVLDLTPAFLSA
jgi:cell division protease FtsH